MKTKRIIIAISVILFFAVTLTAFSNREILRAIASSEKTGLYEINVIREALVQNEKSISIATNGSVVQFPLPYGAADFENSVYPVSEGHSQFLITVEAWQNYLYYTLQQNGFDYEQMGAWISVNNEDNSIQVGITASMFSRYFMRIEVINLSHDL